MSRLSKSRVARTSFFAGLAGTGIATAATAAAWHWLARRPLPKQRGTIELQGLAGRVRVRRDRWGVPHIEAEERGDLYFAQGFCHAQDRLWQMDFYRRAVRGRVAEMAGAEGLPVDRLMRTLGIRRVAEREAAALDPELRGLLERFCAGVNAAAAAGHGAALRDAAAAPRLRALAAGRHPQPRQAARLRALDQLGAGAAAGRHGARARPGADRPPRPDLPGRQPDRQPGSRGSGDGLAIVEQIDAVRRSMGLAAEASGSNNWAVSGAARRHRLAADRRRPAPAAEHAGHLVRGRACATASASSAAPRCRACPASTWARTTTSPGPSPT